MEHGRVGSADGDSEAVVQQPVGVPFTERSTRHMRDADSLQDDSTLDADTAKTPRGEDPPALDTFVDSSAAGLAAAGHSAAGPAPFSESEATPTSHHGYFGVGRNDLASRPDTTASTMSNLSSPLHSAGASSSSLQSTGGPLFPTSTSADSRELYHRLIKVQSNASVMSSSSRAPSGRQSSRSHTSNPSPSAAAATVGPSSQRTRALYEGPRYPDQSFAALHHQPFTPPYPYYRSHSPFFFHGSQTSGSPNRSQEHLAMSSPPNRTGGNTPVESPGLFSIRGRPMDEEMESSQYRIPSLHPTYHNAPKESHSLRKDRDAISGHKIINEYEVLYEIGKGTHGKVKLARSLGPSQEGEKVAIKIVKRFKQKSRLGGRETQEDKVKKEIAVLKKARHHHVVRLIEVIDDPEADKVYMILEYVQEGEMKWRRKADKWIVHFERARVERERNAWERGEVVEPELEAREIDEFNAQVHWRCQEKARILARQKQKAYERISSRKSSSATIFTDDEQLVLPREVVANNWSLEHGNESENEVLPDQTTRRRPSRMAMLHQQQQHQHQMVEDSPLVASNFHYSQYNPQAARSAEHLPFRDPFGAGSDPVSPIVAPPSQLSLPESVEKSKEFQRELKNIQRDDDYENFTDEDEHFRHVPCLTMIRTRECFRDTVLGLEYLHYQGIIHRDIKPANLLWTKDHRVKISDFGVSYLGRRPPSDGDDPESDAEQRDDDVDLARTVGTPFFFAPEICDPDSFPGGKDRRRKIGPQMDIWALGVTLYAMVFARLPFTHPNPMSLFELIGKQEVFIPSRRLRAISLNKRQGFDPKDRPEDLLDYEEVGDELRDLLRRMLHKDPSKRITIKEIKRHPWVVKGMHDPLAWLDQTDPGNYIKDKKIQVTDKDVSAAIAPLTFADRVIQLTKRVSSLVRGRDSSKRATSRSGGKSASASSRSTGPDSKSRRASVRSDDLFAMFRSSRPETAASEHPLSQSQLASPVQGEAEEGYFAQASAPPTVGATPTQQRPGQAERTISTAESIKTIRAPKKASSRPDLLGRYGWAGAGAGAGDLSPVGMAGAGVGGGSMPSPYTPADDVPTSHPASITGRFGGTRRNPVLGLSSKRSSLSTSSKSTSSDRLSAHHEDPHTMPLVAMSPATATGRVEAPSIQVPPPPVPALPAEAVSAAPASASFAVGRRPRAVTSPRLVSTEVFGHGNSNNDDAFDRARLQNMRRERDEWLRVQAEQRQGRSRPHSRSAAPELCPASPDDVLYWANQGMRARRQQQTGSVSTELSATSRPSSSKRSSIQRGISAASSSDDVHAEATFSDNSRHPSMPSVVSASSINSVGGSADESERGREEQARAYAEKRASEAKRSKDALMSTGETVTPANASGRILLLQTAGSGEEKALQGVIDSRSAQKAEVEDAGNDTDAGYNSDQDYDGDSDDEGIVFGGFHR